MGEDAPPDCADPRAECGEELARLGLAVRRRRDGGGIVPDDVVGHRGENEVGVLALPRVDHGAELFEAHIHGLLPCRRRRSEHEPGRGRRNKFATIDHAALRSTMKLTVVVVEPPMLSVWTVFAPST